MLGTKLAVGPILGLESNICYTITFSTDSVIAVAVAVIDGEAITCIRIGQTPSSAVWKAQYDVGLNEAGRFLTYSISLDGSEAYCQNGRTRWCFYVPGSDLSPRVAYASCNGFSSSSLMHKTQHPYYLWNELQADHAYQPFSMLLLGGDQLYADEIWESVAELRKWNHLTHKQKIRRSFSQTMQRQVERFYDELYQQRWSNDAMSLMLAQVPSVMMWDDHDIFDGWGSFPVELQECDVFQGIFKIAKQYFETFQVRSLHNRALLQPLSRHYSSGFRFRNFHILALDNRAERTRETVMSETQWQSVRQHLHQNVDACHLLVLSAVPVVYRDFSFTETFFDKTPWEEELTDDLKDHWRAKEHQGERALLIHQLLQNARDRSGEQNLSKTVILSGDVHIGSMGVIEDRKRNCKIHQVVSSGIVHPAPSRLQWIGIMAVTNDDDEYLDESRNIRISMLKPFSSEKYIRQRNYVTLYEGTDQKLWINWKCEGDDTPYYPIE